MNYSLIRHRELAQAARLAPDWEYGDDDPPPLRDRAFIQAAVADHDEMEELLEEAREHFLDLKAGFHIPRAPLVVISAWLARLAKVEE